MPAKMIGVSRHTRRARAEHGPRQPRLLPRCPRSQGEDLQHNGLQVAARTCTVAAIRSMCKGEQRDTREHETQHVLETNEHCKPTFQTQTQYHKHPKHGIHELKHGSENAAATAKERTAAAAPSSTSRRNGLGHRAHRNAGSLHGCRNPCPTPRTPALTQEMSTRCEVHGKCVTDTSANEGAWDCQ